MSDDRVQTQSYEAPTIEDRVRVDLPLIGITSGKIVKK